jgi:hypothetical protein
MTADPSPRRPRPARHGLTRELPAIVRGLRAKGLRPVTVPQLLLDDPPPRTQGLPPNLSGG